MKKRPWWVRFSLACAILLTSAPGALAQDDWNSVLEKARQEGAVAVFGGTTVRSLKSSVKIFKDKFGIDLLITTGRSSSISQKLLQERGAGLYLQDVMIGGQTALLDPLKQMGVFDPVKPILALPEVLDQKLWYDEKFNWADREQRYLFSFAFYPVHHIAVNTDMVKPGEIQSYYDLLNPKWKDKIVINDPTVEGMSHGNFINMAHYKMVDLDFFRKLAAQKNVMTRDLNLQVTWVAKGKYPIALWPSLGALSRFTQAKAPIKPIVQVKEGTHAGSMGSALGLFNKAPHPNAAKVFVNWFLSREGQEINQIQVRKQTRRMDVPPKGLQDFEVRLPGVKYFTKIDEKEEFILTETKNYNKLAQEIFAPLK
ncbi:MAG: ABC transporter substrate-binding protein [Desulfobacterales bacterium]|nr:ABC transporter substrate-binding protein [Desulfobacterales bacterium]